MRVKASLCVCVLGEWSTKVQVVLGEGGSLQYLYAREGKWESPLPVHTPTWGRLRPETLIMLQKKRDRLKHPSALQGPHTNTTAHTKAVKQQNRFLADDAQKLDWCDTGSES